LILYHDFIDTQERSYMTEDEKLEKKNVEIVNLYRTGISSIYNRENPKNMESKTENEKVKVGKEEKKHKQ